MASESFTSEIDQNAILAELDRILRSTNLAERCEGIVKLPQHFEKYPFPVFISSAFLRLVEVFRNGSNLTRKWILYVAERSEKHLDKIISRDELMKRIMTVSHSNDPNARALTMKLFAYFARILADRKQMHHLICTSLDSNDLDELHAAIFAVQRFAKESPEFGRSVFDKVMAMLMSIDVPPETKLLLVPVFEHFCSDAETSQKAIIFCRDQFLPQCHSSTLIGFVLTSLTKLAVHAVTITPIQLSLLLSHLKSNRNSKRVILITLDCLHHLARETPHIWAPDALKILCDISDGSDEAGSVMSPAVSLRALRVLETLTRSHVIRLWSKNEVSRIIDLCSKCCYSDSHPILSVSCVIAMNMLQTLSDDPLRDQLLVTLTLALTVAVPTWPWNNDDKELLKAAKDVLRCVLQLSKFSTETAQTLAECLIGVVGECSVTNRSIVTECILALCDTDLLVAEQLQIRQNQSTESDDLLNCSLLLAPKSSVPLINTTSLIIEQFTNRQFDGCQLYQLGRRALRYGYAKAAKNIFCGLQKMVSTEQYTQWIKSLAIISTAEECLCCGSEKTAVDRLALAVYNYHLAAIHMRAAATTSQSLWFPIAFTQLREKFLSAAKELHTVWNVAVLVPPSTSAAADASNSRLAEQLSNCEKRFCDVSLGYQALIRRCFDADDGTIEVLKLLRMKCFFVQQAIELLIGKRERKTFTVSEAAYNAQARILSKHLEWMGAEVATMHVKFDRITKEAVEYLLAVVNHLCFEVPFFMPRFFFQSLQTCTVKLVLSPKSTDRDSRFRLPSDQRLLLNVEGVVAVSGAKGRIFRKVERVVVRVSSEFIPDSQPSSDVKPRSTSPESRNKMEKTVQLRNDYFSADFLLDFHTSGSVNVHVDLIDDKNGIVWDGNADEQLQVKVLSVAGKSDLSVLGARTGSVSSGHRVRTEI